MNSLTRLLLGLSFVIFSVNCQATVGYFSLGYGAKSHAMAGATTAAPQDSLAAAVNPAGIAFVGEQVDIGLLAFNPRREAKIFTSAAGASFDVSETSSRDWFLYRVAALLVNLTSSGGGVLRFLLMVV